MLRAKFSYSNEVGIPVLKTDSSTSIIGKLTSFWQELLTELSPYLFLSSIYEMTNFNSGTDMHEYGTTIDYTFHASMRSESWSLIKFGTPVLFFQPLILHNLILLSAFDVELPLWIHELAIKQGFIGVKLVIGVENNHYHLHLLPINKSIEKNTLSVVVWSLNDKKPAITQRLLTVLKQGKFLEKMLSA